MARRRKLTKTSSRHNEPSTISVNKKYVDYYSYIRSKRWKKRRLRKLREVNFHCERCGSDQDLQVHHRTYLRLGKELMTDLEVLCKHCHRNEHNDKVLEKDDLSLEFRAIVE